jgi:hypothetical protein
MNALAELALIDHYENQILELMERQFRDDEHSLTQSDLQGVVGAIVRNILAEPRVSLRRDRRFSGRDGTTQQPTRIAGPVERPRRGYRKQD